MPASCHKSSMCDVSVLQCDPRCQQYVSVLYFEVFGLGVKGQGFVIVEVNFQFMLIFYVVKMEDRQHCFCSAELWIPGLNVFIVAMSLLSTPSTACLSPSSCMIGSLSAYAYFLEMVVGKSEV